MCCLICDGPSWRQLSSVSLPIVHCQGTLGRSHGNHRGAEGPKETQGIMVTHISLTTAGHVVESRREGTVGHRAKGHYCCLL